MSCFKITLLSDLCSSNGESFGSTIDTDIAFDNYGLPIIKGKSLKGCLRECAEELCGLGIADADVIDEVFGVKGSVVRGNLTIHDAHPANYSQLIKDIADNKLSAENVMACYTSQRGQTSIGDDGVAKEGSLRTMRVLSGNRNFICEYMLDEKYNDFFENCLLLLRHMGLNRTRGLGEIKCEKIRCNEINKQNHKEKILSDYDCLEYIFTTVSPIINCKPSENMEYIPASVMMGLCFEKLGNEKMKSFIDNGLVFTNAYISDSEKAFYPNPAFMAKQKEKSFDKDNKMETYIFDTEKCDKANPPALPLKGMNINSDSSFLTLASISVKREINYHHQQSQDNPGIIDGENFYQLSSISAGQRFRGKIFGSKEQLSDIEDMFAKITTVNIGYYRSTGYGACRIDIERKKYASEKSSDYVAVWFHSPVVMYDDNAMPCAKPEVFEKYFNTLLEQNTDGIKVMETIHKYLKFTNLGGFNVTWGMNKSIFQTYDGGTVFVLKLSDKLDFSKLKNKMLGERISEGYGEYQLFDYNDIVRNDTVNILRCTYKSENHFVSVDDKYGWKLPSDIVSEKQKLSEIRAKAIESVHILKNNINATQVGRLLLMLEESDSYSTFCKNIEEIKKENRKENAKQLIQLPEGIDEANYKEYFRTLLTLKKYCLRKEEKNNNGR